MAGGRQGKPKLEFESQIHLVQRPRRIVYVLGGMSLRVVLMGGKKVQSGGLLRIVHLGLINKSSLYGLNQVYIHPACIFVCGVVSTQSSIT